MIILKRNKNYLLLAAIFTLIIFFVIISIILIYRKNSEFNEDAYSNIDWQGTTPIKTKILNNTKDACDIVLINSSEGWKLSFLDGDTHMTPAILYKTNDSGKTWDEISRTEDMKYTDPMPLANKSGITFINSRTGWITTELPNSGYIGLFRTLDGGLTWHYQEVDIPEDNKGDSFLTSPPVFFSKEDGILVTYQCTNLNYLIYVTHDGGESWTVLTDNTTDGNISWTIDTVNGIEVFYKKEIWIPHNSWRTWEILKQ